MSRKSKQLARDMRRLVECTEDLRKTLLHFRKTVADVAELIERGDMPVAALKGTSGPIRRQELTEALQEFEALRHQVRVGFIALAKEQGTSASEVGRIIGISRQLISRIGAEAE